MAGAGENALSQARPRKAPLAAWVRTRSWEPTCLHLRLLQLVVQLFHKLCMEQAVLLLESSVQLEPRSCCESGRALTTAGRPSKCDFWYLGVISQLQEITDRRLYSREKRDRVRVLLEAGAGAGAPGPGWIRYQRMSASGGRVLVGGSLSCGRAPPRGGRPRADASPPGVRRLVALPSRHLGPCSRQRAPRRRCSL